MNFRHSRLVVPLLLASGIACFAQAQPRNHRIFRENEYPDSSFVISKVSYTHGNVLIRLIQVKDISPSYHFTCRVWLRVERSEKLIHEIYLDDIEALGSYFGLFIPNRQPSSKYFAVVKFGDYDGRLYLIDTNGGLSDFPGGAFVVTRFDRYLISQYYSDLPHLEIIDLNSGTSLFSAPETLPVPANWYYNAEEDKYFYVSEDSPDSSYVCDFPSRRFVSHPLDSDYLSKSELIQYDFKPPINNDCGCTKYR